jgi:hypothetical protein
MVDKLSIKKDEGIFELIDLDKKITHHEIENFLKESNLGLI